MKRSGAAVKNIWMLTREYGNLAGAGGVKDVTAQLSRAMANWSGRSVNVVVPLYGFIDPSSLGFALMKNPHSPERDLSFTVDMNYANEERVENLRVWQARLQRVNIYLLESPRFGEKGDVYAYTQEEERVDSDKLYGEGHIDFFAMNLLLQKGALQLMLLLRERPDIIHCHDGHTAVLPAIIEETPWLKSYFNTTACLVTIHNAGIGYHQEVADLAYAQAMTGLPMNVIMRSVYRKNFDPLVCAGYYATVNTVSENYARELQETLNDEQTGWLGHYFRENGVVLEGITNGIDPEIYNPERGDELGIPASFNPRDDSNMAGKQLCKEDMIEFLSRLNGDKGVVQYGTLERRFDLPLFTFIGRLSGQKGIDLLLEAIQLMLHQNKKFQVIILGHGLSEIEHQIISLTMQPESNGKVSFLSGFNTELANRVYSSGDYFVLPPRSAPCGLTDFIAQLFGNLPVVHHVGGLVKVIDGETGFSYTIQSSNELAGVMERAIETYYDKKLLRSMQKKAADLIDKKYTWKEVKGQYLQLYKKAFLGKRLNSNHSVMRR